MLPRPLWVKKTTKHAKAAQVSVAAKPAKAVARVSAVKGAVMAAAVDAAVSAVKVLQARFVPHAKAVVEVKAAPTTAPKAAVNCVMAKLARHVVSGLSVANAQSVLQASVRRVKVVGMVAQKVAQRVAMKAKTKAAAMPCRS